MVIKLVLCIHLMFLDDHFYFSELMNSLKRLKINVVLLFFFFLLKCFFLALFFLSVIQTLQTCL